MADPKPNPPKPQASPGGPPHPNPSLTTQHDPHSAAAAFTQQEKEAEKERIEKEERAEKARFPKKYSVSERGDELKVEGRGQWDHFVGELLPGQTGWLPLDDQGIPMGPATRDRPAPPQSACRVYAMAPTEGGDLLVTNSGAPIGPVMQANTDVIPDQAGETPPIKRSEERQRERLDEKERKREEAHA